MRIVGQVSFWRRLAVALVILAVVDQFVPALVARVETARYESDRIFRFENSDLFSLGPLVSYLREHPRGERPRVAFFGNSMIWGYWISPAEAVPAQFQRLQPSTRVFNMAINGFETGSSLLKAKAVIDSVDALYVLYHGTRAHRELARYVDVEPADIERFGLDAPDQTERALERGLGFWRSYRDTYRLQAGLFGTSTRLFLYMHKGNLVRQLLGREVDWAASPVHTQGGSDAARTIQADATRADAVPSLERQRALADAHPVLWDVLTLARSHKKRAVMLDVKGYSPAIADADRADINAAFWPHGQLIQLAIPDALKIDAMHLSPLGSAAVAELLVRLTPWHPEGERP